MQSGATTVEVYLAELPPEKRDLVVSLRDVVREHLPKGFVEAMNWGMISYEVPMEVSGKTYNGKPLMYAAIGAQKHHVGLYLCGLYCREPLKQRFQKRYEASGKKLDIGKSCIRIKNKDQIDSDAVAEAIAGLTVEEFIAASRH